MSDVAIDGEMSVDGTHLVTVSLCHSDSQIVDVTADCSDAGNIFTGSEPLLNFDGAWSLLGQLNFEMAEVLAEHASGSTDGDNSKLS